MPLLPIVNSPLPGRECGTCTACCSALPIHELSKPARQACLHVGRGGCGQYEQRPASCREFFCGWMRGELPADERYRPDQLGVLVDRFSIRGDPRVHTQCHELWEGASASADFQAWLLPLLEEAPVDLLHRDGSLTRWEPDEPRE